MGDDEPREFSTLMDWVQAWVEAKSIASSPSAMNPTPILVDSSSKKISRHQYMVEKMCDLSRVVKYLDRYDERLLFAWVIGKKSKLPLGQLRRIRTSCMKAAKEESRRPGALFRLHPVKRYGQVRNEYRMGDWGLPKVEEAVEVREAA